MNAGNKPRYCCTNNQYSRITRIGSMQITDMQKWDGIKPDQTDRCYLWKKVCLCLVTTSDACWQKNRTQFVDEIGKRYKWISSIFFTWCVLEVSVAAVAVIWSAMTFWIKVATWYLSFTKYRNHTQLWLLQKLLFNWSKHKCQRVWDLFLLKINLCQIVHLLVIIPLYWPTRFSF